MPAATAVPRPGQPDSEVLRSQVTRRKAGAPRLSMTTREPVPRRQLDESQSGVPPEATTTEVNLEPRSTRHGRLLVETAPTTKVTCSPGPYRCRAERRVSTAQACRPRLGAGEVSAPGGTA